jgi:TRAP-type C4-dicarboxylate transport system substrate-binding protein
MAPEEEDIMFKFRQLALTALAASAVACPVHAQVSLTYSSWVPPTHHLTIWQANWAAEVEKATSGRVKFQGLPKAPAAPPGTFDAVRDGLVDLSYVTASYTPARHILPLMAELPGAGNTAEINSVAFSRIHWKYFQKYGEYKGVKLLGVWTHGPGQMFTKKPVKSLEDFKGQKIRTGGGIAEQVANALGASAFVKPAPESYELLNSGVADGVFFPFESIVSFKLDKVIGQATVFPGGLYSSAFGFFMNEDKWNRIPKADQAIIEKHAYEFVARSNGQSWDRADKVGLDALKAAGANIMTATPQMQAEAKKRAGPIIEDWIKKAQEKHPDLNARKVLAEFHEELKKVAAGK